MFFFNDAAYQFQVCYNPITFTVGFNLELTKSKDCPNVLIFEINSRNIKLSKTLKFEQEGETVVLDVRGLIYQGDFHFTSHIIGTGILWYHDGMTTGSSCENEGDFDKLSSRNLLKCKGEKTDLSGVCKSLMKG